MKCYFFKITSLLILLILIVACSNDNDSNSAKRITPQENYADCKIGGRPESEYEQPNPKIINFINRETGGLFFQPSAAYSDFQKKFKLLRVPPGDKYRHWNNDSRRDEGYANGPWFGAYVYLSGNMYQYGDFGGYNAIGPIYLKDGIGHVNAREEGAFPFSIKIFQNLDRQYHSEDVFDAIREKLGIKDLATCVSDDGQGYGGGNCKGFLRYKHNGRYFELNIYIFGMKDYRQGTGKLDHTVIAYSIDEREWELREYKDCISLRSQGRKLKL